MILTYHDESARTARTAGLHYRRLKYGDRHWIGAVLLPATRVLLVRCAILRFRDAKLLVTDFNGQHMLQLEGISKRYGQRTVVHPLDLKLQAEKTYVLLGPSGCGKSTLLRLIIGLIPADSGTSFIDGVRLSADNALHLRRKVGYVIQEGGLFPHLTAAENVSIVARFLGWNASRIQQRLGELTDLSHFPEDGLRRYPAQLSGGQRQRVGLMRALMLDPAVLLLDEPLGALDPLVRCELQEDLRGIFRALRKTVVIVTHDLHEAAFFADEVLLLRDGRIVQRGPIEELITAPADPFVSQFINAQRSSLPGAN